MDSSAVTAIECLDAFVDALLLVNGVYDVVCAISILWLPASRLGRMHLHVFNETETPAANRIFAYWILTYGLDRIIAGAYTSPATDAIAVLSYLMESATYYNESSVFASVDASKARFVYLASLLLSVTVATRMALVGGPFCRGCVFATAACMPPCRHLKMYDRKPAIWVGQRGNFLGKPNFLYRCSTPVRVETEIDAGGVTNVGCLLHSQDPHSKIGTMVAGNSGHPAGACGRHDGTVGLLHANYKTQEEDIMSNWWITKSLPERNHGETKRSAFQRVGGQVYRDTIYKQWGFDTKYDTETIQGINYTRCGPTDYGDAWSVSDVTLSWKDKNMYSTRTTYPTTLVFVSGPNSNARGDQWSCTARTFNTLLERDYDAFTRGVFCALQAGLTAMAADGCTVALVASVSCGIYAPPHFKSGKKDINADFPGIVDAVLDSYVFTDGSAPRQLGCCFDRVIHVKLR